MRSLKELIGTIYVNKMHLLFGSLSRKNSKVKRGISRWKMGDPWKVILGSVRVRTKHAEKTRVDPWGQLTIRRAGRYNWYQSRDPAVSVVDEDVEPL